MNKLSGSGGGGDGPLYIEYERMRWVLFKKIITI